MAVKARASISLTRVDDVDGLELGGRNLIFGSDREIDIKEKGRLDFKLNLKEINKLKGKELTISCYIEAEDVVKVQNPTSQFSRIGTEFVRRSDDNPNDNWFGAFMNFNDTPTTYKGRISLTFVLDEFINNNAFVFIEFTNVEGKVVKVGYPKLEAGNKATDWSPAPEDVKEDIKDSIDDATTTITEEYRSAIDQTSKQIELMIQSLKTETDANTESITSVTNQLQITTEMAQFVKTTTEQLQNAVDGKLSAEEVKEWARFDGASLELGASNSPFKAVLSNTELAFYQGDIKVARISNNELYILTAVILTSIKCGNFTLIDEGSLGFSLI